MTQPQNSGSRIAPEFGSKDCNLEKDSGLVERGKERRREGDKVKKGEKSLV